MPYALFLDTNVYLHFRSAEEVDWRALVGAPAGDPIVLVVPGVVVREIDKHKVGAPRLQKRAAQAQKRLTAWLQTDAPPIRPGVAVRRALRHPQPDWSGLGLDPGNPDDVLVAAALEYRDAHPDVRVLVVSDDAYPRLRAEELGIGALAPLEATRLPAEPDPIEAEVRTLRKRVLELESAQPQVELRFDGDEAAEGGTTVHVPVAVLDPMTDEEADAAVAARAAQLPPAAAYRRPNPSAADLRIEGVLGRAWDEARHFEAAGVGRIDDAELARYERERAAYLAAYADYARRRRDYERVAARQLGLRLVLASTGAVPAEDTDIEIALPADLVEPHALELKPPAAPSQPTRPRGRTELAMEEMQRSFAGMRPYVPSLPLAADLARAARPMTRPNVSAWTFDDQGDALRYRAHVGVAKHGLMLPLRVVQLLLRAGAPARPFQLAFTLRPANLPRAVHGTLNVVLAPPVP